MKKNKASKPEKKGRKEIIAEAYEKAVEGKWHAGQAATWATKEHGSDIKKADIQYYAMKAQKPYLDEIRMGIRMIVQ
jgi:Asp-tRNA(Asn)/Glu-tRNA(Gln) amidotransferase B subunit